jgi:hypothetical protein
MENREANQAAFEKVVRHLLKQGRTSLTDPDDALSTCAYRSPDGLMCAVGVLIPDDQYRSAFEDLSVDDVAPRIPALKMLDVGLLRRLQVVHDDGHPELWKRDLEDVAASFGLTMPDLEAPNV